MRWLLVVALFGAAVAGCGSPHAASHASHVAVAVGTATPEAQVIHIRTLSASSRQYVCLTQPAVSQLRAAAGYLGAARQAVVDQLMDSARLDAQDVAWDALIATFILNHVTATTDMAVSASDLMTSGQWFRQAGSVLDGDYARGDLRAANRDMAAVSRGQTALRAGLKLRASNTPLAGCTLSHLQAVLAAQNIFLPSRYPTFHHPKARKRATKRVVRRQPKARKTTRHHSSKSRGSSRHATHRPASYHARLRSFLHDTQHATAALELAAQALEAGNTSGAAASLGRAQSQLTQAQREGHGLHAPSSGDATNQSTIQRALTSDTNAARELRNDLHDLTTGSAPPSIAQTLQSVSSGLQQIAGGLQTVSTRIG